MRIEIDSGPSYGMAVVSLDAQETIIAESGAMVAMSGGLDVSTTFNGVGEGGLLDWLQAAFTGLVRRFLVGETLFVNRFQARTGGQEVMLAPSLVGDVVHLELQGDRAITVQSSSWLASSPGVTADLEWGGFAMLFGGEGAFWLRCAGQGDLLLNAYGAIEKVEIDGRYRIDTGHVVAFEGALSRKLLRVGGWKSTFLSGEGAVLEFSGQGTVWVQTRNLSSFLSWITPFLPR